MNTKKHLHAVAQDIYDMCADAEKVGGTDSCDSTLNKKEDEVSFELSQIVWGDDKRGSAPPKGRITYTVTVTAAFEPFDDE